MKTPLTILVFTIIGAFAQLAAQAMPSTFSVYGGGGIGYRSINLNWSNSGSSLDSREGSEQPGFSWSSGLSVGRQITPKFWFRTGARLVNTAYRTDRRSFVAIDNPLTGFGNLGAFGIGSTVGFGNPNNLCGFISDFCVGSSSVIPTPTQEVINEFHTNFRQVEIPFILRYELNHQRLSPYVEAGVAANYLLFSRLYSVRDGRKSAIADRELDGPGRFGATAILSVGAAYGLTESLDVFIHPVFRYNLRPISFSSGDLQERPRSLVLEAGIRKTAF
jgi:hypothetical protein